MEGFVMSSHLTLVGGNPKCRQRPSKAPLTVIENRLVPLRLKVNARLHLAKRSQTGDFRYPHDLLAMAKSVYGEMPYSARHNFPLNGDFTLWPYSIESLGDITMSRCWLEAELGEALIHVSNMNEVMQYWNVTIRAMNTFSMPWFKADWIIMTFITMHYEENYRPPAWLIEDCARLNIKLVIRNPKFREAL